MVYEGVGKLITVVLTLVIMLMLLVIPWDPIPLSFIPCQQSICLVCIEIMTLIKKNAVSESNILVSFLRFGLPGKENDLVHELVLSLSEPSQSPLHHWSTLLC